MIKDFDLENYGPIISSHGKNLGQINLILGKNSTGKLFCSKLYIVRYVAMRSPIEGKIIKSFPMF